MKKSCLIAAIFCLPAGLLAQKQSDTLTKKESLDPLLRTFPQFNQPFVVPFPKEFNTPFNNLAKKDNDFETTHPGARMINKTARGTIYNMPTDNMAVLVPDMNQVERMPEGKRWFNSQGDRMPNPLKPKRRE